MHVHIEVRSGADQYCPLSGLPLGTMTAEVSDSRIAKDEAACANAPRADQVTQTLVLLCAHAASPMAVRDVWLAASSRPPLSRPEPGIAATPQAP